MWALDVALAAAVAVALVIVRAVEADRTSPAAGFALAGLAALLLAARHLRPATTLAATLAMAVLVFATDEATGAIALPVLIALYTVAQVGDRREAAVLAVVTAVTLAVARGALQRDGWSDARTAAEPAIALALLFLGWAVRSHRDYIAEIKDRARRAEMTREQEARRRVDAERLRIAREVHDVVAHTIAMINVQAGVGAHVIGAQPERAAEALRTIEDTSKEALHELRGILGVLRGDDPESLSPVPAEDQLDVLISTARDAGLRARFETTGARAPLPAAVGGAAYRIVQESLTNVLRHAGPASVSVRIAYEPDRVVVRVDDDGRGRGSPALDGAPRGHGITGMRERARTLGGELSAGPRRDGGFSVRATLPLAVPA